MFPHSEAEQPGPWYASSWRFPVIALLLGICLAYFSQLPLYHTDLWGHLSYGKLIWESGQLSSHEPFLQQAENIPMIDTAWLARWVGAGIARLGGATSLQFCYGILLTGILGIFFRTHYKLTHRLWFGLIGAAIFLLLEWKQLVIIRPQLVGILFYVWLWCRLQLKPTTGLLWSVPPVMLLWANMHGSFIMGSGLVCCMTLGRALDLYRESKQFSRFWLDTEWKILMLCSTLAITVPLLNPYGLELYLNVLGFADNPNLYSLIEWQPLSLKMFQGKTLAGATLFMLLLWIVSPRKLKAAEILLLLVLGYVTLKNSRMIIWLAPVIATQIVLHLNALWEKQWGTNFSPQQQRRSSGYTSIGVVILLISCCFTPLVQSWVKLFPLNRSVSSGTPLGIADYINQQADTGNLFNTMEWGDYLIWSSGGEQQVFVYSHVHLIPREIWTDYLSIMRSFDGWEDKLEHYQIDTIALENRSRRKKLIQKLQTSANWQEVYRDRQGYVFIRNRNP